MKIYNRKSLEILETNLPTKVELSNGNIFTIQETIDGLVINLLEGTISIKPQYGNQICLQSSEINK